MKTLDSAATPDFDRMAAAFDRHLHLIADVGEAVLAQLPALGEGALAVDVACGSGEPGLTLARRAPRVQVIGVDAAPGMIELAKSKAARERLANIRFELSRAEALPFDDASVDAVVSRFGALMFGDRIASARELSRVLRPGGAFSVAVWDGMKDNTLVSGVVAAIRPHVPAELVAPFDAFPTALAADDLRAAGLRRVEIKPFAWSYGFASEETFWQFVSGPGVFGRPFEVMNEGDRARVRAALDASFTRFRTHGGEYRVPHVCRLYFGAR